jgi:hypothetical protein
MSNNQRVTQRKIETTAGRTFALALAKGRRRTAAPGQLGKFICKWGDFQLL